VSGEQGDRREAAEPSHEQVANYLLAHPDFFRHEPTVLSQLQIPDPRGEGVVSLLERQQQAMRERHVQLELNIAELVQVARENEQVNRRLHDFALELMAAANLDDVIGATLSAMQGNFEAELVSLRLIDQGSGELLARDRAQVWPRSEPALDHFVEFFRRRQVVCGQLTEAQTQALFGERADEVGSVALLPLKSTRNLGLLALAHGDQWRFHPAKGMLFLTQLGELLSQRLSAVLDVYSEPRA
jgi:hypothetical protein